MENNIAEPTKLTIGYIHGQYEKMILRLMYRYHIQHFDNSWQDCYQSTLLYVVEHATKFDKTKASECTYIYNWIRGGIKRWLDVENRWEFEALPDEDCDYEVKNLESLFDLTTENEINDIEMLNLLTEAEKKYHIYLIGKNGNLRLTPENKEILRQEYEQLCV